MAYAAARSADFSAISKRENASVLPARRQEAGLVDRFKPDYVANRLQAAMTLEGLIADGKMGVMNGSGYFDYGDMKPDELFRNRDIGLLKLKAAVETVETETPLGKRVTRRGG
ncbi:hypothetical protein [Nisaea sp.]|uniref:hypothetical protein n=1 Tax=Nisaea sp. TaxID=2024842 RepID=UPI0032994873